MELDDCNIEECNTEDTLWWRKKYWQPQLFTNVGGVNIISDLYSVKRKANTKPKY